MGNSLEGFNEKLEFNEKIENYKKAIFIIREITQSDDYELLENMIYHIAREYPEVVAEAYKQFNKEAE